MLADRQAIGAKKYSEHASMSIVGVKYDALWRVQGNYQRICVNTVETWVYNTYDLLTAPVLVLFARTTVLVFLA